MGPRAEAFAKLSDAQKRFSPDYRAGARDKAEQSLAELRAAGGAEVTGLLDLSAGGIAHLRRNPPGTDLEAIYVAQIK